MTAALPSEWLGALVGALGERAVDIGGGSRIDGVELGATVRPADGDGLRRTFETLSRAGAAAVPCGGGNRLAVGNPLAKPAVAVSLESLRGIETLDAEEGVCRVKAGTPLVEARAAVNESGWELPLDATGSGATVGGVLAAAEAGPRALGFRAPRDVVLGLEVVSAAGVATRCGGRVVKNVTGYDMNKLYTGSFGCLAVIEAAWLRLAPLPRRVVHLFLTAGTTAAACEQAVVASRLVTARAVVATLGAAKAVVAVELAGEDVTVQRDVDHLTRDLGARAVDIESFDAVRRNTGGCDAAAPEAELVFRIPLLPTTLADAAAALVAAGAEVCALPGLGWLRARFAVPESGSSDGAARDAVRAAFDASSDAARSGQGARLLEAAPAWVKTEHDVFGELPGADLMRALKRRFDPSGVLNPGRMVGRL